MSEFNGYLFSKLQAIGSKSEGPLYLLQQFDYKEIVVRKEACLFAEDPKLHPFLNKKVTIEGDLTISGIVYDSISDYVPKLGAADSEEPKGLQVELELGEKVVVAQIVPPDSPYGTPPPVILEMTLRVKWPYRSIWEGLCPTAQTYDFSIEREGKTIWRWSDGRAFAPMVTPVLIPGGSFKDFAKEAWITKPEAIESEGTHTVRAVFLATGQEATADFEIEFAYPEKAAGGG